MKPLETSRFMKKKAARLSSLEDCSDETAVQCREKIKKLKSDYRKTKDSNNRSGRGRTICAFLNHLSPGVCTSHFRVHGAELFTQLY